MWAEQVSKRIRSAGKSLPGFQWLTIAVGWIWEDDFWHLSTCCIFLRIVMVWEGDRNFYGIEVLYERQCFWNVGYMKGLSDGCVQFPDDNSTGRIFQHSKHRRELVPTACVSCWNQFLIGYSKPVRSFSFQSIFSVHSDPIATIVTSLKCCRRCHVIWAVRTGIWSVERICCLSCCRRAGSSVWESGSHIDNLHTLYIYIIIMRIMEWQGHNARKLSVEGGVT